MVKTEGECKGIFALRLSRVWAPQAEVFPICSRVARIPDDMFTELLISQKMTVTEGGTEGVTEG